MAHQRQLRPLWPVLGMRGGTAHAWMKLAKPRWLNVRAQLFKGSQKGNNGMKGSWKGPSWTSGSYGKAGKGFQTRPWAQNPVRKGIWQAEGAA